MGKTWEYEGKVFDGDKFAADVQAVRLGLKLGDYDNERLMGVETFTIAEMSYEEDRRNISVKMFYAICEILGLYPNHYWKEPENK